MIKYSYDKLDYTLIIARHEDPVLEDITTFCNIKL